MAKGKRFCSERTKKIRSELAKRRWSDPIFKKFASERMRKNPPLVQKYCQCGCGEKAKPGNRLIHGHNALNGNHPMSGKRHSEESKSKMRKSHPRFYGPDHPMYGKTHTKEVRKKLSSSHTNVPLSEKHRVSIGKASKKVWASKTKEERINWATNIGKGERGKFVSNATKIRCSEAAKKLWINPEHAKKCLTCNSPNKQEIKILEILNKHFPKEWEFVGNGQVLFNRKCPDFINVNGQKKIIELWGERWHQGEKPKDRENIFKPFGYSTLVIWAKELNNLTKLRTKLEAFCLGQDLTLEKGGCRNGQG